MPASKNIPWTRLIAEGVAIVVSILLAFSIDAWWAHVLERRAQSVELTRLHEEFSEIRRQLDMESRERVVYAAAQLLEMSQGHIALRLRMNQIFDSRLSSLGPILDEVLAAIEHELDV